VSNDPTTRLQEHPVKNTSRRHHQSERPSAQLSRAVGIRPQPDQVADEMAIRGLAHAFADAVNRRAVAAFESLFGTTTACGRSALRSIRSQRARRVSRLSSSNSGMRRSSSCSKCTAASSRSMVIGRRLGGLSRRPDGGATADRTTRSTRTRWSSATGVGGSCVGPPEFINNVKALVTVAFESRNSAAASAIAGQAHFKLDQAALAR
jgi:hypothetical protein